jgi:hypothetical protein
MNVQIPQKYAMLHMLTPFVVDIVVTDPWPSGHSWAPKKPAGKDDVRNHVARRPLELCNPEWEQFLGSESDQRPETLYMLVQQAYADTMVQHRLVGETGDPDFAHMRTLLAAFFVLRGFVLTRRHNWDWSALPPEIRAVMPEDVYGPEA